MSISQQVDFAERLKTQSEAKQALLAKFKPKPTVTDPNFKSREEIRAAELERVRRERAEAKAIAAQAALEAKLASQQEEEARANAELEAKRGERKERKALTKAEAKAKRDARYAARKARK